MCEKADPKKEEDIYTNTGEPNKDAKKAGDEELQKRSEHND